MNYFGNQKELYVNQLINTTSETGFIVLLVLLHVGLQSKLCLLALIKNMSGFT